MACLAMTSDGRALHRQALDVLVDGHHLVQRERPL
jgi:hypothetical protein